MELNNDQLTLHQLEQELNVKIVPGTEVMTDVGTHHFIKSSSTSDRVLVPQPSDDPHDPLASRASSQSDTTVEKLTICMY
ncbi:MAG: hypothetical protein Q9187_007952 [Circinaria calcarea]